MAWFHHQLVTRQEVFKPPAMQPVQESTILCLLVVQELQEISMYYYKVE
jgi:hypothetical protein